MKTWIFLTLVALVSAQIITTNFGCRSTAADGVTCLECSSRFYKDKDGICQPVSSSCKTYNTDTGACTSCYDGFLLLEVVCIPDPRPQDNSNCNNFTDGICHKCSRGFYLLNNTCEIVSPLCKTFNYETLLCSECYGGYRLVNSTCEIAPPEGTMAGCSKYNGSACVLCARDYFMNSKGVCVQVDSNCKSFDKTNGVCLQCFPGWKLENSSCVVQPLGAVDPNCKKFQNNSCVECSRGFYFNSGHVCVQVDPFCKAFNYQTQLCTECYSGFSLSNNTCVYDATKPSYDVNCKTFNSNGVCQECSKGYYFQTGVCVQVNSNCKQFDYNKTICTACFSGYTLENGQCARTNSTGTTLKNCASELSGVCVKCVERAYYDINNNCVMVSDFCKEFNTFSGYCTSCYTGYALNSNTGECLPSETATCKNTDTQTKLCTECVKGYYLDIDSQCKQIDVLCQTFNFQKRVCEQCFKGYLLNKNNGCDLAPVLATSAVKNCVSYDVTGLICVKCYDRYYLSSNECKQVNPLCKTYNGSTGACESCYGGFSLTQDGQCIYK